MQFKKNKEHNKTRNKSKQNKKAKINSLFRSMQTEK